MNPAGQALVLSSDPEYRSYFESRFHRDTVFCDALADVIAKLVKGQLEETPPLMVFLDGSLLTDENHFSLLKRLHELSRSTYFVIDFPSLNEEQFRIYQDATDNQVIWFQKSLPVHFRNQIIEQVLMLSRQRGLMAEVQDEARQTLAQYRQQNALFNSLLSVVQFDANGKILAINQHFSTETGWEFAKALGRSIHEVVLWSNDENGDGLFAEDFVGETRYFDASGQQRWAFAQVKKQTQNHVETFFYVAKDISERKQYDRQQQFGTYQEGLLRAKSELIHDLGNTLNSMNASQAEMDRGIQQLGEMQADLAQWISQHADAVSEEVTAFLTALDENVGYLKGQCFQPTSSVLKHDLEQMIASVNRQQQGLAATQYTESVNLYNLIQELVKSNQALLAEKGIRIQVLDTNTSIFLRVSRNQLFQVLLNLVKNAVEAIEVSAKPERLITLQTFQDASETRLIVHDSGDGIAEENLNRVFHFGFTTKSKGTGHGLHSVANFMDACQGKIEVASSAEAGTSFILVFPRLEPLAADVSE